MGLFIGWAAATIVLPFIPAHIGEKKGRSWVGFFLFGLVFWIGALITALIISPDETSLRGMQSRNWRAPQTIRTCDKCGAATPEAVSFCTTCRAPSSA